MATDSPCIIYRVTLAGREYVYVWVDGVHFGWKTTGSAPW
jgi:hypothetical protein